MTPSYESTLLSSGDASNTLASVERSMGGRDNQKQAQVEGSQQNNKSIVLQLHTITRAGIEIVLR